MEENIQGKYFSINDRKDISTVIYQVNKTEKEFLKTSPKYTVERLDYIEEIVGEKKRKTFFVDNPAPDGNPLVILSFAKEKVLVNMGFLDDDTVKISKKPVPISFKTLYSEKEMEYKDFLYTPNMKRPISIIDPETTEEVKPILYFDENANNGEGAVRGKCKLKPYKKYFAFEIKDDRINN